MENTNRIKSYKGFDKDLKCRGEQFNIGETKNVEGKIVACNNGFHACEEPLKVFEYYPPATSRYCEVEQFGDMERNNDKIASRSIKVNAEIGIPGIVKAQIEYVKARTTSEHTDPKLATAGDSGAATAGSYGAATAGYKGAATAGSYGAATAGDSGAATSRGSSQVGANGLAVARGNDVKVKGGLGSVLVICEENESNYEIKEWRAFVVDGFEIKADTWYQLKDGKLVEAEEDKT